ncbi:PREDICTED: uncharacterized protein LOC109155201 [Ipomoea nil]|uniref:uncharacterized protein LOC109155201 n=1 Tax=Ipomoea nil TaxID=35883 RepID=UPI000901B01B|nr:PREDICTED: uncharacterized protein LOC109155201 [Ipomoea nil]
MQTLSEALLNNNHPVPPPQPAGHMDIGRLVSGHRPPTFTGEEDPISDELSFFPSPLYFWRSNSGQRWISGDDVDLAIASQIWHGWSSFRRWLVPSCDDSPVVPLTGSGAWSEVTKWQCGGGLDRNRETTELEWINNELLRFPIDVISLRVSLGLDAFSFWSLA